MLATAGALPEGAQWAYELKWDGVRVLADRTPDGLRLSSRSERDLSHTYPELADFAESCADALFDGEIVALEEGRPSFAALAPRMHVGNAAQARRAAAVAPVTYLVFDVLRLYGVDLTGRPYAERRQTLERLDLHGPAAMVPPTFDDGPATVRACREQHLEGVVAKRLDSVYRPGRRSPDWVKVRLLKRQEFVVCGFEVGVGGRTGQIGSLVLGYYADGDLRYAGQVGSGLTGPVLKDLESRLKPLHQKESPFAEMLTTVEKRGVTWCVPRLVVEVSFGEWTPAGRLRFPTYQGLRDDKDPREVVREPVQ
ncbi:MAG TPA: non-homologous end-joining DNA ligase [Mycobacteriales bacterium]|nr:non-homologous end-joining DNA ligase [Mycobacteriales bacterium]